MRINPANRLSESVGAVAQVSKMGWRTVISVSLVDLDELKSRHLDRGARMTSSRLQAIRDDASYLLGFIDMREFEKMAGPAIICSGYYEVTASVAAKGWGPALYDCALLAAQWSKPSPVQWIPGRRGMPVFSDRGAVSKYARKIWETYFNDRPDVEKSPIGKRCPHIRDYDYLNYAYSPGLRFPGIEVAQAFARYRRLLLSYPYATKPSPLAGKNGYESISRMIDQAGNGLFIEQYDEVVREERGE